MKEKIKALIPNKETIQEHKHLQWLGRHLHDNSLWHLNRGSVSRAFAVGLFSAFVPVPFQMILATIGSIWFSANLPIAIALVWITNPLTMPPIYYAVYKFGAWMLNTQINTQAYFSVDYLFDTFGQIWQPLLLGSFVVSTISAVIGYFGVLIFYHFKK
jgi:uncharacterized protein (DUF2062 family)